MKTYRLLDLCCKAGGASMGYFRAGFTQIVGVDLEPQKRYPFEFVQGDAIEYVAKHGAEFDLIHASPHCQGYSVTKTLTSKCYPKQIEQFRDAMRAAGKPYVIENVVGAPLINPVMLCGSMFGLRVQRHRLFETWPAVMFSPFTCNHWGKTQQKKKGRKSGNLKDNQFLTVTGGDFLVEDARIAMGISWMTGDELAQAIPPAYTEWLGKIMLRAIQEELGQ